MSRYEYFPEDKHGFLHHSHEENLRLKTSGYRYEDVIDILSEELNHIQSLFGIDTHLTMASW